MRRIRLRRIIIISIMTILSLVTALKTEAQIIKGEVFTGLNLSQVDGDDCYGYKHLGFVGGAGALIPITNYFDIGLEVLFSQKGAYKRDSLSYGSDFSGSYNLDLNYVEIPVIAYLTDKDWISAGLGVSYGRLVYLNEKINGIGTGVTIGDGEISIPGENSTTYNGNDFSIVGDLRVRVYEGLHLSLRYQYSLAKIRSRQFYDIAGLPKGDPQKQFNNTISLRAVYIFNEKRSQKNIKEQSMQRGN